MKSLWGFLFFLLLFCSCDSDLSFPDPALDTCVRNDASKYKDDYLTQEDLDKITVLICAPTEPDGIESGIRSLSGIERLHNLEKLGLSYTHVSDISPVSQLKKLKIFGIETDQKISSYVPVLFLPLTLFGVWGAEMEDISFLVNIPTLEELNLERNNIIDLTPIKQLPNLKKIDVSYNKITTLKPIAEHPNISNLVDLSFGYNCIDCLSEVEAEYMATIQEKNPELYMYCNSSNQLLPENCGE